MQTQDKTTTLGIDPGYERLGIAVVEKSNNKERVVFSECFKTDPKLSHSERLLLIGNEVDRVIRSYSPKTLSIETLFFNDNQKTAMKVSEARGVILFVARSHSLVVREFTPLQIKAAITGDGRADKKQMIKMLQLLVPIKNKKTADDEYDAVAAALTAFATKVIN